MSDTDSTGRRKRTIAQSTGKKVSPTERDMVWLKKIHEHGPLSTSFLHNFTKNQWSNEKKAKERLTDLFNEDNTPHKGTYLKRPKQQFQTIDARYNELVYDLSTASERALKEAGLWSERSASSSGPWWHGYMVSRITASIELATLERDDLNYTPQSAILERADTDLRYPTTFTWPNTKEQLTKDLIPDALFGLEYVKDEQKSYRFYVVEADRGTEPGNTSNAHRKSIMRNFLQYRDYIGAGKYKEHLKLTAPMMVLQVSNSEERQAQMMRVLEEMTGTSGGNYQIFNRTDSFPHLINNLFFFNHHCNDKIY